MEQLEKPATRGFVLIAILAWAFIRHSMQIPFLHGADANTFKADGNTPNTPQAGAVGTGATSPGMPTAAYAGAPIPAGVV